MPKIKPFWGKGCTVDWKKGPFEFGMSDLNAAMALTLWKCHSLSDISGIIQISLFPLHVFLFCIRMQLVKFLKMHLEIEAKLCLFKSYMFLWKIEIFCHKKHNHLRQKLFFFLLFCFQKCTTSFWQDVCMWKNGMHYKSKWTVSFVFDVPKKNSLQKTMCDGRMLC